MTHAPDQSFPMKGKTMAKTASQSVWAQGARKRITAIMVALAVVFAPSATNMAPTALAADCRAKNNLNEIANSYISRCRNATVRREFPGQYLNKTLRQIKSDHSVDGRTAWKLLTDARWNKR